MTYIPNVQPLVTNRLLLDWYALYNKCELYYSGNGVYDDTSMAAYGLSKWLEAIKPLRQVSNRSVEFYATKMLVGNVQIVTGEEGDTHPLLDALNQVLTWSNFDEMKQLYTRDLSKLGDLFLKVQLGYADQPPVKEGQKPPKPVADKVYIQQVPSENVVKFEEDERGYLISIRIETPIDVDDQNQTIYRTEYYTKKSEDATMAYYSVWESNLQYPTPLDEYGEPKEWGPLAQFGIDFAPFVHDKFKNTGALRGTGCFTHTLDKQDEANRQATRLAQMVFKKAGGTTWLRQNAFDKDNRPLAPAPILDAAGKPTTTVSLTDDIMPRLPSGTTLESTVPNIAWEAIRNIANDMVEELKEDMPELRYYSQTEGANMSGKALSYTLAPALDRAREAGTNFATGLTRALKMALTMGQFAKVLQVAGSYDAGDFDHTITVPDPFPPDDAERAITTKAWKDAGLDLPTSMEMAGCTPKQIEKAQKAADEAMKAKAKVAVDMINKIGAQNDAARKEAADKKAKE